MSMMDIMVRFTGIFDIRRRWINVEHLRQRVSFFQLVMKKYLQTNNRRYQYGRKIPVDQSINQSKSVTKWLKLL